MFYRSRIHADMLKIMISEKGNIISVEKSKLDIDIERLKSEEKCF